MIRRINVFLLLTVLLFTVSPAQAQQAHTNIRHIGFLSGASFVSTQARVEAFRQGLGVLGYVEGKNVVVEWRFAEGNFNRLPSLAADLVQLKVDAIVVAGGELWLSPRKEPHKQFPSLWQMRLIL